MLLLNSASSADVSPETCRHGSVSIQPNEHTTHFELFKLDRDISMLEDLLDRICDLDTDTVARNQRDL
jgi:hypothetical protein